MSPPGLFARVRSIHAQNRPAERGKAGDRCALNLAGEGIGKEAIRRGDVILDPELHAPTDRIDARLRVLPGEPKPIGQWFPVRLHHAAAEVGARIVLLGDDPVRPGGIATVQLVLDSPIAAAAGDAFVVRDTSAQRTIGGGSFLDLRAPSRKRRTPERLARLEAYAIPVPERAVAALLDTPPHHLDLKTFARDRALGEGETESLIESLGLIQHSRRRDAARVLAGALDGVQTRLDPDVGGFPRRQPRSAGHRDGKAAASTRSSPSGPRLRRRSARSGAHR